MIWQTKKWQDMLFKSNQIIKYFVIDNIYIEKRSVGLGENGLFILGCDFNIVHTDTLTKLINLVKTEKALFLQIENINYNSLQGLKEDIGFKEGYYKKFITPYTAVIDLKKTQDEILSGMKPKGRYNIKLAEKKGVYVNIVEKTEKNVKIYYDLMLETTKRDSFNGHSLDYYKIFLNEIESSKLLFAFYEGTVIAGGIFIFDKENTIYYYGASTSNEEYRNLMAPYLLQWTAINIGKDNSSEIYDFLGVSTPGDDKSSLIGVTDFKKKFTQDIRMVSSSYIYINKKVKYNLITLIRKMRSKN